MKVRELIERLQKVDLEIDVYFLNDNYHDGKPNAQINDIIYDNEDSFERFTLNEKKRYEKLQQTISFSWCTDWIEREKLQNKWIKKIDNDIMLSDYAKKIKKEEIYNDKYYSSIEKDKAYYNKIMNEIKELEKKIVKKKIIVLTN